MQEARIEQTREELIRLYREAKKFQREKGRETTAGFVAYMNKDYKFLWYNRLICEYLDKLERGDIKKLMIFLPPQHGKSELSSRQWPSKILGTNPDLKVGICSYAASLASGFNRDIQNIITSKEYKQLFRETKLNEVGVEGATNEIKTNKQFEIVGAKGGLITAGVKGTLTGNTLDVGIFDDPFKDRAEANSKVRRDAVWDFYQDVFCTRIHDKGKQLLLFTRWHEDDIAGRILDHKNKYYDKEEAEEWVVLAIPAIKEAKKPLPQAEDINDPREIGDALWEERHGKKKILKYKRIKPSSFNSLFQQRPTAAEGNKIKKEWFVIRQPNELPFNIDNVKADFFIDGAFTEKTQNDETGLGSAYYNKADGRLYILNISGLRKELYEFLEYFPKYAALHNRRATSSVFIELKASGYPIKSMLSKVLYGGFNTRAIPNKVVNYGKFNRVENAEPFLASGRVVLVNTGNWINSFIEQAAAFPNGAHDDKVDVLAYMIDHYMIKEEGGGASYA